MVTLHGEHNPVFCYPEGDIMQVIYDIGKWLSMILSEMGKGNFSFLILIVGIIQIIVMFYKRRRG